MQRGAGANVGKPFLIAQPMANARGLALLLRIGQTVPSSRTAMSPSVRFTFSYSMKACNSGSAGRLTNCWFLTRLIPDSLPSTRGGYMNCFRLT